MSQRLAIVLSSGLATLRELQTVYGYEDMLNLCEIAIVNGYNEWCAVKSAEERNNA